MVAPPSLRVGAASGPDATIKSNIVHEYSIVQALLDRAEVEARARDARSVTRLRVAIGALAGVEQELLRSAFELARVGTRCAGAELEMRSIAASWRCRSCEVEIGPGSVLSCPSCGAPARLVAGDEIVLERLELEVA
ncbi:MAG TPA: hydrogenase maturation nickel metallochaperone HypA [Thermoanaerobaculia bacterium]|nr:hydrogenase maturation nickel metallochaperone HypA [Thermoanaerobaculia bacterium]